MHRPILNLSRDGNKRSVHNPVWNRTAAAGGIGIKILVPRLLADDDEVPEITIHP